MYKENPKTKQKVKDLEVWRLYGLFEMQKSVSLLLSEKFAI